ncbi:MAG: PH domain-containing protein, partial [Pseudomonadota bacterium]|nr:PH domain-containing protein [Pseudomonadota bacterium]
MTGETVADRRLHPGTLLIRFVRQVPEYVVGAPALIALASDAGIWRILLIALAGAAIALFATLLSWLRFRYGVGEREIVIESGVFHRQRRVIPFDRIQDIDIEQRLLARLFGLARVRIETGGAAKDEGSLDAVSLAEAYRLREGIRNRGGRASVELEGEAPGCEPELFRMEVPRLLLAGLFNFSLVFLAVLGGAFQYFDPLIDRYLEDAKNWVVPRREQAAKLGLYFTIGALLLLVLLGVITGLLRTIARDYRFRLSRSPGGLRRQRGLFTLSEVLIPLNRVQLALVETGWIRKRLGWYSLDLQTLNADAQQSGHQDAAPFARMEEILPILAETGIRDLPPDEAYVRVSRMAIVRRYLSNLVPLLLAAAVTSIFWPLALLSLVPLLGLAGAIVLQWQRHLYALADRAIYIREGVFRPRLWIVPFDRTQAISVRRSPLQRRF